MKQTSMAIVAGIGLAIASGLASPVFAGPTAAFELEHARANARAGGPISDYDAELLERWGNSTGGPDWRKQYRAQKGYRDVPVQSDRDKSKRRIYRD